MIFYAENKKKKLKKTSGTDYIYSKIAGCKVNMRKSFISLYTRNEQVEFKI